MTVIDASNRWKAYRARQKAGRIVIEIEVDEIALSDALTKKRENGFRFLHPDDADDREKLSEALARVVELWIEDENENA